MDRWTIGGETLVNSYIYLEGGASGPNSKNLNIRCQQAFHNLLDRMGFTGRKPRLVACGGRGAVYERFCTEHRLEGGYVAMWIDSEEPLESIDRSWKHLAGVTSVAAWERPAGASDDQILFMTVCMETWIVADREALRKHYGHQLQENVLPSLYQLEDKSRHDIQDRLERATRFCKNVYAKGKHSFAVLSELDPEVLKQHLPSFVRVDRILKEKL